MEHTETERVWARLRARAISYSAFGSLVSMNETRGVAIAICSEEFRQRPDADAIDHMATELVRMTLEASNKQVPLA